MPSWTKDPGDVKDYAFDWRSERWLEDDETIVESSWTLASTNRDDALVIDEAKTTHDDTTATVWLSGGTLGVTYAITNHIVTSAGREADLTARWTIRDH